MWENKVNLLVLFSSFSTAAGSVPVISVSPRSLTVSDGEEALFECTANGDPTPTIRWSRENGQISQSSSSVNGVLRIFSAKPEDEGTYVCRAANTFGAKAILVTLNVEKGNLHLDYTRNCNEMLLICGQRRHSCESHEMLLSL